MIPAHIEHVFKALEKREEEKPSPDVANCDVCDELPGERTIFFAGTETWVCEQCAEEHTPRRRFRSRDEYEAYEAGVPSRAERTFRVQASDRVHNADDSTAVIVGHAQVAIRMTIAQARELSLDLARAADDAELKLKD